VGSPGGRLLAVVGSEVAGGSCLAIRRWWGRGRSRLWVVSRVGSIGCSKVAGLSLASTDIHLYDIDYGCSREAHSARASGAGLTARSHIGATLAMVLIVISMIASRGGGEVASVAGGNVAASRISWTVMNCIPLLRRSLILTMSRVVMARKAWDV